MVSEMIRAEARPALCSRVRKGEVVRGAFVGTPDATLCELVALLGWDFLLADAEHSAVSVADLENIARACELRGATAGVRVKLEAASEISRFMDAGASLLMVPFVENADQARRAVELMKFPPLGTRGVAAPRSAQFGLVDNLTEELARANEESLLVVQIESRRGLDNIEEIAAVEGVDVLFLGPADLSVALGAPLEWESRTFKAAVAAIAEAASRNGKRFGAYAGSAERLRWYEQQGATFIATALEDMIALGSSALKT